MKERKKKGFNESNERMQEEEKKRTDQKVISKDMKTVKIRNKKKF